jgi:PAS domain S-box-containing protein
MLYRHQLVAVLDLGIVSKIDLAEIRAPFIRASLIASGLAAIVILIGTTLLSKIGNPIIERLTTYSRQLEGEVEQRRQREEEIRTINAFLDTLVDMSPFAMWVSDADGTIVRVNRSLAEALHLPSDAIIGVYNVFGDKNLQTAGVLPQVRAVFEKCKPTRFSIPWRVANSGGVAHTSASDMHIDVSMFPIVDPAGELTNVVCQWVDISEQKAAEAELEAHREHLEEVVEERTKELRKTVKLMAGRENRMAELKEEISRLHEVIAQSGGGASAL